MGFFGGKDDEKGKPESSDPKQEKRREARLDVGEPAITMTLDGPDGTVVSAEVVNVSARGLRLRIAPPARALLTVGQDFTGSLQLEKFEIRMTVRLVRLIGENEGGFRIRTPFPKDLDRLERYLEPRFLGKSLREIDPAMLQRQSGETKLMRWFQGHNETSLFSWDNESGDVAHQQLLFLERVVEWDLASPVRTGRIRGEGPGLSGWVKADLLEFDTSPDAELVARARILIGNSSIDSKVKEIFLAKVGLIRPPQ